jgi:hypothetical protein
MIARRQPLLQLNDLAFSRAAFALSNSLLP